MKIKKTGIFLIMIVAIVISGCSLLGENVPPELSALKIENEGGITAYKKTKIVVYGLDGNGDAITYSISSRKGNQIIKEGDNVFYFMPDSRSTDDILEIKLEDSKGGKTVKEKQVIVKNNFGPKLISLAIENKTAVEVISGKTAVVVVSSSDIEGDKVGEVAISSKMLGIDLVKVDKETNKFIYNAPITTGASIFYDTLTVKLKDEFNNVSSENKTVAILANLGPKLDVIKIDSKLELKVTEGRKTAVTVSAIDEEGDTLKTVVVSAKSNSKIENTIVTTTTGIFSFGFTPTIGISQEELTFTLTDNLGNIRTEKKLITVLLNTPPEMKALKVNGVVATNVPTTKESLLQVIVEDKEGDEISSIVMSSSNNASITKVDGKIGEFKYLPTDITKLKDTLTIQITDSAGKIREANVILDLLENNSPNLISSKINGAETNDIIKGEKSIISLDISDPDGDTIKSVSLLSEKGSTFVKQPGAYDYEYVAAANITEDKVTITIKDSADRTGTFVLNLFVKDYAVKEVTYIVYMAADNDLNGEKYYDPKYDFAKMDLDEIIKAEVDNSRINVVVLADFQYDAGYSRGVYIKDGKTLKKVKDFTEEPNTGDKTYLTGLIDFAYDNYKAKKYILELWGHGVGWWDDIKGSTNNPKRAMGTDWTVPNDPTPKLDGDSLDLWELEAAITDSKIKQFDLIHTDMCLMATVEVAYQLKNICKYFAASPELTPGPGADYKGILEYLSKNYNKPTPEQAINIQETNLKSYQAGGAQYDGTTEAVVYSVFDMSKIGQVTDKINSIALKLAQTQNRSSVYSLKEAISASTKEILTYGGTEYDETTMYVDLGDFMTKLSEVIAGDLKTEIDALNVELKNRSGFIIYEKDQDGQYDGKYAKEKGSSGISVFFDFNEDQPTEISKTIQNVVKEYSDAGSFGRTSEWTKFLASFYDILLTN